MAIGAHIGDAELTCGKTLATHSLRGDMISTVAMTAGERGAPHDMIQSEFSANNIKAAETFAKALGGRFFCMYYPDGEVPDNEEARHRICELIRIHKPDVVLTHWANSLHKDHIVTHRIVNDGVFYAGLRGFSCVGPYNEDLQPHRVRGPYYAENWEDAAGFEPYVFVNVSEGYDLWHEHVQGLWLTNNSPWFKYLEYYDALSKSRGLLIKKERAECFNVLPHHKRIVQESF